MKTQTTQLAPAMALVQLLQENPGLPAIHWTIDASMKELRGFIHHEGMHALSLFAEVLGGSIRPDRDYQGMDGRMVRPHRLHAVWRDVRIEITTVLLAPVAVAA